MRRVLWRVLYPFAWALNRLGLCSYEWVNVGVFAKPSTSLAQPQRAAPRPFSLQLRRQIL